MVDLCAVGFSRHEDDVEDNLFIANKVVQRLEGISSTSGIAFDILKDSFGYDEFEALRSLCLIELGRKAALSKRGEPEVVEGPSDVLCLLEHLINEKREYFYAILLDAQNQVMRKALIHIGTLNMSLVGPREVFREAVRDGASSVVVSHNHPSGDVTPSPEDIEVTRHLVEVGKLLDIPVLDHVIIGHSGYRSLRESGLM